MTAPVRSAAPATGESPRGQRDARRAPGDSSAPPRLGGAGEAVARALAAERPSYLAFVRGRVRSGADAEDILQQALVKAAERASDLRDPERVRAWFFQILRRTLADHHARWAVREAKLDQLSAELADATPEEVATCACSLGQLERLRPEYAEIVRRVDLDDEPLPEAAAALGITANNATVRLHRARKALREQLRAMCGTDSARGCLDCGCD
ncbi:MAG: sigma-70 family RNA polymerase sigma factor [Labilithrix sp.]|nr:sigma-70 family RNA polymerase sigma factor [Labilithrix sp.]